jgi:hypothetical protein
MGMPDNVKGVMVFKKVRIAISNGVCLSSSYDDLNQRNSIIDHTYYQGKDFFRIANKWG